MAPLFCRFIYGHHRIQLYNIYHMLLINLRLSSVVSPRPQGMAPGTSGKAIDTGNNVAGGCHQSSHRYGEMSQPRLPHQFISRSSKSCQHCRSGIPSSKFGLCTGHQDQACIQNIKKTYRRNLWMGETPSAESVKTVWQM